jgi:hypothetical protein
MDGDFLSNDSSAGRQRPGCVLWRSARREMEYLVFASLERSTI